MTTDCEVGIKQAQQFLKQASVPERRTIGLNALVNALANTIIDAVESGEYYARRSVRLDCLGTEHVAEHRRRHPSGCAAC
jgi:hypothetical protein